MHMSLIEFENSTLYFALPSRNLDVPGQKRVNGMLERVGFTPTIEARVSVLRHGLNNMGLTFGER